MVHGRKKENRPETEEARRAAPVVAEAERQRQDGGVQAGVAENLILALSLEMEG